MRYKALITLTAAATLFGCGGDDSGDGQASPGHGRIVHHILGLSLFEDLGGFADLARRAFKMLEEPVLRGAAGIRGAVLRAAVLRCH